MQVEICKLTFNNLNLSPRYSEKIRGYLGNKYIDNNLMHNHDNDKFIYRYPLVQYKVINNKPIIIGINEAAQIIANIGVEEDNIIINGVNYDSLENSIIKKTYDFGEAEDYIEYKFETPWIALSQKNNSLYKAANEIKKEDLLKKILIGNIISMSKGFNYTVKEEIKCWINLKETEVNLKGIKHTAFLGNFKVNFYIPDYLGLGKSVSRGFGTIKII
ncbi:MULTISPECIES: CRISPR-associated endonuclease Cas6 [Eubacteriales]|uniref:DNA repair protein n=1 Tax=Clostridium isatidis TaxID=182773 RepID=A0A343JB70_9CLOT|nr:MULTISPECIES: CRISPR-associated endonuclease Cas6 [Eubacteriales]ASW42778.1 hypothetical protein BEN51_04600 [Clostridium isatidis]MBU5454524.1 CRISPR-associated endonuclease Cas6 [Caproiciproducens sp. MSJ-32]